MNDDERRVRTSLRQLFEATPVRPGPSLRVPEPGRSHRWLAVAATAVVIAGGGTLAWKLWPESSRQIRSTPTDLSALSTSASLPPATSVQPTTTVASTVTSVEPATSPSTLVSELPEPTAITRPYIDPSTCSAGTKSSYDSRNSDSPSYPFARGREAPIPIQIIGSPAGGPGAPFAVLLRYFATAPRPQSETMVINGVSVGISTFVNGNGAAAWELADGSNAYMRTRGLDKAEIAGIITSLTPRDRAAPIPGFDYQPADSTALTLVAEAMNTDVGGGLATRFSCTASDGFVYHVDVLAGVPSTSTSVSSTAPRRARLPTTVPARS